jgi:hypothetical protein
MPVHDSSIQHPVKRRKTAHLLEGLKEFNIAGKAVRTAESAGGFFVNNAGRQKYS